MSTVADAPEQAPPSEKLQVKNLYKIFGRNPEKGLELVRKGKTKEEVRDETGMTVGVQDASFTVNTGEIFVVMGLSGSGKSTLVRMLNRLIQPTSGQVLVDGVDVASMDKEELLNIRRRNMCMVFQSFALMPHMTVLENVAFGLEMAGVSRAEREERAMKALSQVGLEGYDKAMPGELSGGMQQRVGLARGLAVDPEVLLMDEAFSALDPLIRTEMQDELLKLQGEHARTIVFISHDLDEAMRIGDRIAIMEGGRIVQVGTPEDILRNPADDYVKAFFRGVDPTNILTAKDIVRTSQVTVMRHPGTGLRTALEQIINWDREYGYVLDSNKRFISVVSAESLKACIDDPNIDSLPEAYLPEATCARSTDTMQEVLPLVTKHPFPIPVVDENDRYIGVISKNIFLRTLQRGEATQTVGCAIEQDASSTKEQTPNPEPQPSA